MLQQRNKPTSKRRVSPVAIPKPIRIAANKWRNAPPPTERSSVQDVDELKSYGVSLYQSGSCSEAFLAFTWCIEKDPSNPRYYLNRALVSLDLKLFNQARADSNHALTRIEARRSVAHSLLSHSPDSSSNSGSGSVASSRRSSRSLSPADSAISGISPTLSIAPSLVVLYERDEVRRLLSKAAFYRGTALYHLGRWEDALVSFRRALSHIRDEDGKGLGKSVSQDNGTDIESAIKRAEHLMATKISYNERNEWVAQQGALDLEAPGSRSSLFGPGIMERKLAQLKSNWAVRFQEL